jgi:hypothetical protein
MKSNNNDSKKSYSLLGRVEGAEKAFLSGRRNREEDLESAVTIFLEFLLGMGGDFWGHLRKFLQETMVQEGVIDVDDLDLIHRAHNVDEALRIIKNIHY